MGFFSDMLKMAASEVVNAVVDGINESVLAEEEKTERLAEFREMYAGVPYSTLVSQSEYQGYKADEIEMIKSLMKERKQFAELVCTSPSEAFQSFDDEDLVKYFDKLVETQGAAFPDAYVKKVVKLFQEEVMNRPVAKRMYMQAKEDCYENYRYDDLEIIIEENNVFYNEVLKREAQRELECRNYIIEVLDNDVIEELDNDEFMKLYAIVREDKDKTDYSYDDNGSSIGIAGTYNNYLGKYRNKILKNCEREIVTNRSYLVAKFLSEYCEEEYVEFLNYSNKKLSSIISLSETETSDPAYAYDLCDKLIAESILSERGC